MIGSVVTRRGRDHDHDPPPFLGSCIMSQRVHTGQFEMELDLLSVLTLITKLQSYSEFHSHLVFCKIPLLQVMR